MIPGLAEIELHGVLGAGTAAPTPPARPVRAGRRPTWAPGAALALATVGEAGECALDPRALGVELAQPRAEQLGSLRDRSVAVSVAI